ncbi:MAG: L,D-transpeptidase family protein [Alphaproteobacteria bacterium]|nr:L,D-transpeptidase family protein [Alphaproteobacteria bacterium]
MLRHLLVLAWPAALAMLLPLPVAGPGFAATAVGCAVMPSQLAAAPRPAATRPTAGLPELSARDLTVLRAAVAEARAHGLDPRDYPLPESGAGGSVGGALALRLASDLRDGRIAPAEGDPRWYLAEQREPLADGLKQALASGRLAAFLEDQPPPHAEYRALRAALARLDQGGALTPVAPGAEIVPWSGDPRWPDVISRLMQEGHLAPAARDEPAAVAQAILDFQGAQGLATDGRIGPRTLAALGENREMRRARIVANMERWRWMPRQIPRYHVMVSVAEQSLRVVQDGTVPLAMPVVIGRVATPTPSFAARISGLVINPAWNIPTGIARNEILPRLRRDPAYLAKHEMRLLNGPPDDPHGLGIDWRALPSGRFPYLLQQAPGPANPLGAVRFDMPNPHDIFLHDTPLRAAFARQDRALSHGCVRLSDAAALAELLAGLPPGAFAELLAEARARGASENRPLARAVPVFVVYLTAFADEAGQIRFAPDIYGRDARLMAALDASARP